MFDTIQPSLYPHRIYLLKDQSCDICSKPSTNVIHVDKNPFVGYVVCNSDVCIQKINHFMTDSTISHEKLRDMYGETVRIIRSSGLRDDGWYIYGAAYKESAYGPYWVRVRKGNSVKCIELSRVARV